METCSVTSLSLLRNFTHSTMTTDDPRCALAERKCWGESCACEVRSHNRKQCFLLSSGRLCVSSLQCRASQCGVWLFVHMGHSMLGRWSTHIADSWHCVWLGWHSLPATAYSPARLPSGPDLLKT
eukprot:1881294-Amphidinium_carterae.1